MESIIPLWQASTLQECLQLKGLLRLPRSKGQVISLLLYNLYLILYISRGLLGSIFKWPLLQKIMCYDPNYPTVHKVIQLCASLAAFEVFAVRIWFHWRSRRANHEDLFHLLHEINPSDHRRIIKFVKFVGFYIYVAGTSLLLLAIVWITRQTAPDDVLALSFQLIWALLFIYCMRYQSYDMIVIYAAAAAITSVIRSKLNTLHSSIVQVDNSETSRRCLITSYLTIIRDINKSRGLVACINNLNQIICIPLCAVVLSLILEFDANESHEAQILLIVAGCSYGSRGYFLTAYCACLNSKSIKIHGDVLSRMTRCRRRNGMFFSLIISDIAGKYNHLVLTDSNDGTISQLDVLRNLLGTLQFLILFIQLKERLL